MLSICLVFICLLYNSNAVIDNTKFIEVSLCILTEDVIDSTIVNLQVSSKLKCAGACAKHAECQAFRISQDMCSLHNRNIQPQTCTQYPFKQHKAYNDINVPCLNGGIYEAGSGCQCIKGCIGTRCEKVMKDCVEVQNSEQYPDGEGVYLVHPDGAPKPLHVICILDQWGGRTYLMKRNDGLVGFNRPWADYKSGFGDLMAEFWLGLDKIHFLTTSRPQDLIVAITTRMPNDMYPLRERYYSTFRVGNESTGYALDFESSWSFGGMNGMDDCLTSMKGKRFTTSDVDNDDDPGNCASVHEGAWWFTGCGDCNPTGPMVKPTSGYLLNIPNEVFWYPGISKYSIIEIGLFLAPP